MRSSITPPFSFSKKPYLHFPIGSAKTSTVVVSFIPLKRRFPSKKNSPI
jgi:hypothetical protein